MARIASLHVKNFRSLADVELPLKAVNVFFGANGSGKSTLLDTLWFVRDCAIRGVELASADRSHGIGILFDGAADDDQRISITMETEHISYSLRFDLASGSINSMPGEELRRIPGDETVIQRNVGVENAILYNSAVSQNLSVKLREPEKLSLNLYMQFNSSDEDAGDLDRLLHFVRLYHSRSFLLHRLKTQGSESGHDQQLKKRGENAWSVLRNLHDRKHRDTRFDTIMEYMTEAFPTFDGIVLEQTGPNSVYGQFLEKEKSKPILASGVSDGHLQMLLLLTALFSEGKDRPSLILFDEPEISLHPWALAVFAKAVREAGANWNKQILAVTHSPVLISQFEASDVIAAEIIEGRTRLQRVSEIAGIGDLLSEYAAGSLYMAQMIGPQAAAAGAGR